MRFDPGTGAWREARNLVRLQERMRIYRGELHEHGGASRIIERTRDLSVPILKKPEHVPVSLMMGPRRIG
jgi:hypothetical protein